MKGKLVFNETLGRNTVKNKMFRVSLSKKTGAGGDIRQRWDPMLETV